MKELTADEKIRLANRIVAADREEFSVEARLVDYEEILMERYFEMADYTLIRIAKQLEAKEEK